MLAPLYRCGAPHALHACRPADGGHLRNHPVHAELPDGTPPGGPALLPLSGGAKKAAAARRPLGDVTMHYAAHDTGSICIGALGGGFGLPTGPQPAAQLAPSCGAEAARAAQTRAAVRRQALRSMR